MPISPDQHSPSWDGREARGDFESGGGTLGRALGEGFRGIVTGITDALNGVFSSGSIFAGIGKYAKTVRDGQQDLNDRTDLLSPLLDYGSVTSPAEPRLHGNGRINFTKQLGPMRGVEVYTNNDDSWTYGGLRLLDKGLWDIYCQVTIDQIVLNLDLQFRYVDLDVHRPDGSLYSTQRHIVNSDSRHSATIVTSVVIPEPGYRVLAYVRLGTDRRGVLSGPMYNRLTAQHISREVDGNWFKGNEKSTEVN